MIGREISDPLPIHINKFYSFPLKDFHIGPLCYINYHVTSFSRVQSTSSSQWDNIMNMFCFLGGYFRAMRGLAVAVDCFIKIPSGLRPNLVFQLPSDLRSYEPNLYAFGSAPGPRNSGVSLTSGRSLRLRPFTNQDQSMWVTAQCNWQVSEEIPFASENTTQHIMFPINHYSLVGGHN